MNLVVDIGNSFSKLYAFEKDKLVEEFVYTSDKINFIEIFNKYTFIENAIISSVTEKKYIKYFTLKIKNIIDFNHKTKLPIKLSYKTPETLGLDRIAAVVGASSSFENQNILIIDAGTAITYDFINADKNYLGGNISPGLKTRFKSLNTFTKNLPLVNAKENIQAIGQTTEMAIVSGVQQGLIYEIEGYINHFENNYKNLKVILTGGDCFFFEKRLKKSIFVVPNLIALGLNQILKINV